MFFVPQPFNEKHALLMSASPSMGGGNKALWSLRMQLEHPGASVFPNMLSLAIAIKRSHPKAELPMRCCPGVLKKTLLLL